MTPLRIIIADDHGIFRQGVKTAIESQRSWELCGEADNGRAALELARKHKPEIAVLDISMAELNGLEVTRQLKTTSPKTKVLILTMHDSEALADEALLAGARGYLLKSDAAELLPKAIEALAAGKNFLTPKLASAISRKNKVGELDASREPGPRFRLTPRERQIVILLAEGKPNKEVAYLLEITLDTAETHRKNILNKLGLRSMAELVRYAIRIGLIEP